MMRFSRPLGLLTVAAALAVATPSAAAFQDSEVQELFRQGLRALEQNDDEGAVSAFQQVLALDPSREDAYQLWKSIDNDVWLDLMVREGQMQLAAERILELARAGRAEAQNDPAAIRQMLGQLLQNADDVIARRQIAATLAAKHGEYVVPAMLPALGDAGNDERRVLFMRALEEMGHVVVMPLIEATSSPEPRLRRHVALALGRLGDRRALGTLMLLARGDEDTQVRLAAEQALSSMVGEASGAVSAADMLTAEGLDYALERDRVLGPYGRSAVVWRWSGDGLVGVETDGAFFALEVAKRRLARALDADPSSVAARSALALAGAKGVVKLEAIEAAGGDADDMRSRVENGHLQALAVGSAALDGALRIALEAGDEAASVGLLRALADTADSIGDGVRAALGSPELRVRGEAALAVAHATLRGADGGAMGAAVDALAACAGQEVLRQAIVIDSDAARARRVAEALGGRGMSVAVAPNGVLGLRLILDVASADVVLVGSELSDLTADRILDQVANQPNLDGVPVVLLTRSAELGDAYGDRVAGVVTSPDELASTVEPLLTDRLSQGQKMANDLAARACAAIDALAASGRADALAGAADSLAVAAGRDVDAVAIPALGALARVGDGSSVDKVVGVAADGDRTDAARIAAADCLAALFRRGARPDNASFGSLSGVVSSDASIQVRAAAARALGALDDPTGGELSRSILGDLDPMVSE
ncbi:HEAT repeat domain-containing protein [Engelhardtia mirabilis]|uniref:HEAT repeat protein n=1 Tax=Engelhardtia mirabilis TaxID=2528011 RepID=A0A518BNP5_9BACT|nr:HEAT repeat protein [Planctomycetes bacterium Pla133]QDV02923.1 HEAT repeat protein [Planctomycetes bacterium Pla86]